MERAEDIIKFWFGKVEESAFPTANRTHIWFGHDAAVDDEIRSKFSYDLEKAVLGEYSDWEKNSRSSLALIILFDQFSRHIYRDTPLAFAQDHRALDLCLHGIERQYDHLISLIERAFFYFPLMHSENVEIQATSIRAYKILLDLSFPEAKGIFENFLDHSLQHFDIVKRFGRFPDRNQALGRISTEEEIKYLEKEYLQGDK
ncbi:MAG: DUF924 domain-containing protein [Gammaproteobacteria bacterium]|nr:DUF924 domain-containing protein [Gammaproteobacteria bacterium]